MHKTLAHQMLPHKAFALLTLTLSAWIAPAHALDIAPYSAQTLAQKQQAGEAVSLHFHAKWCPTCLVQEKAFNTFKGDATVPGTLLVVDHDQERELKRQMGVRAQSTLIVFKGQEQKHRSGGVTDPQALKAALLSAQ
jgi:thiol:disulfide interchange protein